MAPLSDLSPVTNAASDDSQIITIRKSHIGREATIRALGGACYVFAGLMVAGGVFLGFALIFLPLAAGRGQDNDISGTFVYGGMLSAAYSLAVAWLVVALGRGLRRLMPLARSACIVLLGLVVLQGLIVLVMACQKDGPMAGIGLALCGVTPITVLGLLLAPSTKTVFTSVYREAVRRSPTLKPRLRLRAVVAAVVILSLLVLGAILAVIAVRAPR